MRPPAIWTTREILNAIFYVLRGGIAWRLIPKDLPPRSTAFGYFSRWRDEGLFGRINHHLVMADRERVGPGGLTHSGRARQPEREDHREWRTTRLRCGQEGEGPQAPGHGRYGWARPGPRTSARRHAGSRRSRAGVAPVPPRLPLHRQSLRGCWLCGEKPATATIITVEIVRKPPDQVGFAVHPRRWVVERFFSWISRNRRLWKDPEATLASARAFLYAASVMILMRRIARST